MADAILRLNAALEGRYRVERELGEGGMATVYLADDLRHERKVALKVLKPELAAIVGAERFLAEIKTTAGLQHPHILPLHDSGEADGFLFYVMPYVEGESLRQRLDREHQLPVDEAVRIATNVAEALDYAHRRGVIHRDIKPANILLQDGKPVVSDYGIALALGAAGRGRLTETGLSLGTPHYMSPEQATGDLSIGAATDVYALGCVLYEMLVGEPPYTGSTPQAVLGRIVTGEPRPVTEQRSTVPPHVEAVCRRALEKVPADRFGAAGDMAGALGDEGFRWGERASRTASEGHAAPSAWRYAALALGAVALLSVTALLWPSDASSDAVPRRFSTLLLPPNHQWPNTYQPVSVSSRGNRVVYTSLTDDGTVIRSRVLEEQGSEVTIPGTEGAGSLALSPDGDFVAFNHAAERVIKTVRTIGGQAIPIAETGEVGGQFRGISWGPGGTIVFATTVSGLQRVPAGGGTPELLTEAGRDVGVSHRSPEVLPDGSGVLFTISSGPQSTTDADQIAVLPFGGEAAILTDGHSPQVTADRILVFARSQGELWAARLTEDWRALETDPVPVMDRGPDGLANARYVLSEDGTLFYVPLGTFGGVQGRILSWVHRDGTVEPILPAEQLPNSANLGSGMMGPRISPDGARVAFRVILDDDPRYGLFVLELGSGGFTRIAVDINGDWPVWLDNERLIFNRFSDDAGHDLYVARADGSSAAEPWTAPNPEQQHAQEVTPDGRSLLIQQRPASGHPDSDILVVPLDEPSGAAPLWTEPSAEVQPTIHPNGRWLAYASNRGGRFQVYVTEYPVPRSHRRVSEAGGTSPAWGPTGEELFYRNGDEIWSVGVSADSTFLRGDAELVYDGPSQDCCPIGGWARTFDVSPDGESILLVQQVEELVDLGVPNVPRIEMAQGWLQEVERRLGVR